MTIPSEDLTLAFLCGVMRGRMRLNCMSCRKTWYRSHVDMARQFGGRATLRDLRRKLECGGCGRPVWRSGGTVELDLDTEPPPRWYVIEHGWGGFTGGHIGHRS